MEEKVKLLKTECRTGSSEARRKTIAIYHQTSTDSGWEYYASGAEREARIIPTTDQQPGNNWIITSIKGTRFEEGAVNYYIYDHLGNTRMTYAPTAHSTHSATKVF